MSEINNENSDSNQIIVAGPAQSKNKHIRSALRKRKGRLSTQAYEEDQEAILSSPLLTSTPKTVSRSLVRLYPYLIVVDNFLSIITWSNDNISTNLFGIIIFMVCVIYFGFITKYFGHLMIVGIIWVYLLIDRHVQETMASCPSLDDIIHVMDRVSMKSSAVLSPITILSAQDVRRLLFTIAFLSPVYIFLTMFVLSPNYLMLMGGLYILTYHSKLIRRMRRYLWKFRIVRLLVFFITDLDLGGPDNNRRLFASVNKKIRSFVWNEVGNTSNTKKTVLFKVALFENQRRWLGIGWTSTMLSYERASWTDEFLNTSPSPEMFTLPEKQSGMAWEWHDKDWMLDLTNDGAIQVSASTAKTKVKPGADEGFTYYDNTWNNPSATDTYKKYTRRRRWIRTATVTTTYDDEPTVEKASIISHISKSEDNKGRKRKVSFSTSNEVHIIPSSNNSKLIEMCDIAMESSP
ncbi:Pex31p [Saccharomyces cerevisiae x Saccharomyces kudriavzevii VIN7]|uniref:Pex31p n=1 Tax=Saccharomyces cerevisiae x Saccharomyces kudriavzevii (strain VIN7) TaxID=1095631 RepID=H0GUY4_SACCK|nr:Pex31p [Saccharomyces cerevisiae x Saccharomyces kudriavzevii VIN7]